MRYVFEWHEDDGEKTCTKQFRTSCPQIGETVMQRGNGIKQMPDGIQNQFDTLFTERGAFQERLRAAAKGYVSKVSTGIDGLTIKVEGQGNKVFDLSDRPNNYS